jgi:hypothetical protein
MIVDPELEAAKKVVELTMKVAERLQAKHGIDSDEVLAYLIRARRTRHKIDELRQRKQWEYL